MNNNKTNTQLCDEAARCWYLTGATASGKTAVAIRLSELIDAEIISLDSMAIYRGMDIGTAKPSPKQQQLIKHHLIDILDPNESFSVSQYRAAAHAAIDEIRSRGKDVLFVGGTALYLKALLRGLFDGPPADWEFRKQIEAELKDVPNDLLFERLKLVDPVSAHKLHPNDRRRIVRALEVYRSTGQPISHQQMEFEDPRDPEQCKVFTLRHPRPILHERIESRVDSMFEQGLVDEVRGLLEKYGELGHTASQAVGYREVIAHLNGEMDHDQMVEKVRVRTRRFARHQETWFRGLEECRIVDLEGPMDEQAIANQVLELGRTVAVD